MSDTYCVDCAMMLRECEAASAEIKRLRARLQKAERTLDFIDKCFELHAELLPKLDKHKIDVFLTQGESHE